MTWIAERASEDPLPFASPNATPSELLLLGRQSLTDGWQLARTYFRAALNRVIDQVTQWLLTTTEAVLGNPVVRTSIGLVQDIGREALQVTAQLAPVAAPGYRAALRLLSPIQPGQMWHWLMLLLALDGMLWAGLLGLFGLATAEGSEPALSATQLHLKVMPPPALVFGHVATALPTTVLPTATPLPLPTATPIPLAQSIWQPSLPAETGWSGADTCSGEFLAPTGSGFFAWPTNNHYLSGYDYSAWWHQGLDLSTALGDPIYAADNGLVIYAGWNTWGYGNAVIIDHGNGWHTLYAHLSQVNVACGQAVEQSALVGQAGSTGHSTGPHLHFEMRFVGEGRVNPWLYLP